MKLSNRETASFLEQLSMILTSGLSIRDGIETIGDEVQDPKFKEILAGIKKDIDNGESLYQCLKNADYFDDYMVNMIDVGEKTGYLDSCLKQLSIYYDRLDNTYRKIKEAITYPSIIFIMMILVMGVLIIKVLPVFNDVLNNMGVNLSVTATWLMNFGQLLANYGFVIAIVIAIIIFGYVGFTMFKYKDDAGKMILQNNIVTKNLSEEIAISKFAYALSLLLNSGYDIDEALKLIPNMIDHPIIKNKIIEVGKYLREDLPINEAIIKASIFKPIYNRMLSIGYKAGKIDEVMSKIARIYEDELDSSINKFLNIIEPTMIIISVLVVGVILLSVMLPLMSIMSSIG